LKWNIRNIWNSQGHAWTGGEDRLLPAEFGQGKPAAEAAEELASKLGRTERAVKDRFRKLKHRQPSRVEDTASLEKPLEASVEKPGPQEFEAGLPELRSLLESTLLLAEDPKHKRAPRLILGACLKTATENQEG
jgi:hypothetical protein